MFGLDLGILIGVLEQGLILGLLALGVYITYKILDFPDLSVDGTFVLGGSISAVLINKTHPLLTTIFAFIGGMIGLSGNNPLLATFTAFLGGMIGGLCTGILHVHLRIKNILSGILVMIGLYSINLRITKFPNLPVSKSKGIYSILKKLNLTIPNTNSSILNHLIDWMNGVTKFITENELFTILVIVILIKVLIDLFLKTKLGMLLRITGDNPNLVTSLGINLGNMKILGLMIANGIVALSGSLLSQYHGVSDIGSGSGKIVIGLAAVIMGEALLGRFSRFIKPSTMVLVGAILYNFTSFLTLKLGLNTNDFKLVTALIIISILGFNNHKNTLKSKLNFKKWLFWKKEETAC